MPTVLEWFWRLLPANPILLRIVQGGSRRLRHLWVRMGYLGTLIILVIFGLLFASGGGQINLTDLAKAGTWIFAVVSYGQVVLICLLAPLFMAGAIAEEQQGQTYDILLTTPLSSLQIVLGSLFGRLFFILALLASGLPLFSILLIFGGVPIYSVFMAFWVAGLVALVLGSVAVALSVSRKGGRKTVFIFVISVAAYFVACYSADRLVRDYQSGPGALGAAKQTTWLTPLHPILVLESYLNTANYKPPAPSELADQPWLVRFYRCRPQAVFTTLSLLISSILTLWSAFQVRRISQNDLKFAPWAALKRALGLASATKQTTRKPRTVWANPIAWREANVRGNRFLSALGRSLFIIISLASALAMLLVYHLGLTSPFTGAPRFASDDLYSGMTALLWIQLAVIMLVAIYISAGSISREREDGTLDLLLTTPITPKQYIWGKLRGLVSFLAVLLAAPILTMLLLSAYTTVGLVLQWPQANPSHHVSTPSGPANANFPLVLPEAAFLFPIILVPFVAVSVAIGMSWSVKAKGVLGAVIPSLGISAILILVLGFCGVAAAGNIPIVGSLVNALSPATCLITLLNPWELISGFANNPALGRTVLAASACLSGLLYAAVGYAMLQGMVKTFDQTVRRLSGGIN